MLTTAPPHTLWPYVSHDRSQPLLWSVGRNEGRPLCVLVSHWQQGRGRSLAELGSLTCCCDLCKESPCHGCG